MSQVLESITAPTHAVAPHLREHRRSHRAVVVWGVLASLALIGSGAFRFYQTQRYQEESPIDLASPFPLKEIPQKLDGWHLMDGSATVLDPLTTRITGSIDHTIGNYINEQTGVTVTLLALFGPAEPMLPHTPEVCYPSSGYKMMGGIVDRNVKLDDGKILRFRTDIFVKSGGRAPIQEMVYHSFRHDGDWIPTVNMKNSPRKNPLIYKVQVVRRMVAGEQRTKEEPIEGFLRKMIPELERMIASGGPELPPAEPVQTSTATTVEPTTPAAE